jgi:hypothetical protein
MKQLADITAIRDFRGLTEHERGRAPLMILSALSAAGRVARRPL